MDRCKGAAVRAFLLLGGARAVGAAGAGEDPAGGEEDDVAVGEFFFELAGEAVVAAGGFGQYEGLNWGEKGRYFMRRGARGRERQR